MSIKNNKELLSHGNIKGRKISLDMMDYALRAINSP